MQYLGHAWCRSDSQILARNGVFVVTVACKSKTTQSELFLDEASAVCQARTPRRRRMRIRSENSLCRLWDFERPRPQIPIPRHRKDFVVVCCCVYSLQGIRPRARGGRARSARVYRSTPPEPVSTRRPAPPGPSASPLAICPWPCACAPCSLRDVGRLKTVLMMRLR